MLRRWATETLTELRRQYESASRPLLTQLTGTVGPRGDARTDASAVERDLDWLRHEHPERANARQ